jgi:hypothetical protein
MFLEINDYQIYRQDRSMVNVNNAYNEGGILQEFTGDFNLSEYRKRTGGGILLAFKSSTGVLNNICFERYLSEDLLDAVMNIKLKWYGVCTKCDPFKHKPKTFLFSVIYRRPNKFKKDESNL